MAHRERKCVHKKEFAEELAWKTGLTVEESAIILSSVLDIMTSRLICNQSICLDGFGTFEIRVTPERPGRNPQTLEGCVISAGFKPVFRASRKLREAITRCITEGITPEVTQNLIPSRTESLKPGKRRRRKKVISPPKGYPEREENFPDECATV